MTISRILNFLLIIIGGFVALYAQAQEQQNQYILIGGIFILMLGIYRISRNIPSKNDTEDDYKNNDEF